MGLDHLNKSNYFNREASRLHQPPTVIANRHSASSRSLPASSHTEEAAFTLPDSMVWWSLPIYQQLFPTNEIAPDVDDENLLGMEILQEQQVSLDDSAKSASSVTVCKLAFVFFRENRPKKRETADGAASIVGDPSMTGLDG